MARLNSTGYFNLPPQNPKMIAIFGCCYRDRDLFDLAAEGRPLHQPIVGNSDKGAQGIELPQSIHAQIILVSSGLLSPTVMGMITEQVSVYHLGVSPRGGAAVRKNGS